MLKEHVGSIDFKVKGSVLIIVLMEHAQRDSRSRTNDCRLSLNPYFNGTCSKSVENNVECKGTPLVLILILMEHAQRACMWISLEAERHVLILILMEHAQREKLRIWKN